MATKQPIKVGLLNESELKEAGRIIRLAFGTFLGLPNPLDFMGDRNFLAPRWSSPHVKVLAARDEANCLIGSNVVTRWGSFGFFGPLTVLPEYWDKGVAQKLLQASMAVFDKWKVRHSGLFTFPQSPKHVSLYQKFGYWPGYLTAIMTRAPEAKSADEQVVSWVSLSELAKIERERAIRSCSDLTNRIHKGLDLSDEMRSVVTQHTGEVILTYKKEVLEGFAICMNGAGSEGGEKTCYVKFGAARNGTEFEMLLSACEAFASSRNSIIEAGVNMSRVDAYRRMRSRGFRIEMQGVAMQNPHEQGFNRANVYVIDDWR